MPVETQWHRLESVEIGDEAPISTGFFPRAWTAATAITRLGLRIETEFTVRVTLLGQEGTGMPETLVAQDCPPGLTVLSLPPLKRVGMRVSCLLTRDREEITSAPPWLDAAWMCDHPPERHTGIAAVICTRNRETQLRALLVRCLAQIDDLTTLIVVNQGEAGLQERLDLDNTCGKLRLIEQDNQGGAGGFTRGILEALALPEVTHILLMDDDVQIDAGLFERTSAALAYLPARSCLGGAMIDDAQHDRVLSLGHGFDTDLAMTTDTVPPQGAPIDTPEIADRLATPAEVAFCGWWCFCFPVEAATACGLPMPLFLRGDDAEYGMRLRRSGFKTIMWPGIFVLHPFLRHRTRPWHHFYDRRNALICATLQTGRPPMKALLRLVRGIVNALGVYRYAEARAGILAIEAYLDGAAGLSRWDAESHERLVTDDERRVAPSTDKPTVLEFYPTSSARTAMTLLRLLGDVIGTPRSGPRTALTLQAASWKTGTKRRPRAVIAVHGAQADRLVYDSRQARVAFLRLLRAMARLVLARTPTRSALLALTRREWWETRLKSGSGTRG